jgi:hypothetical protein
MWCRIGAGSAAADVAPASQTMAAAAPQKILTRSMSLSPYGELFAQSPASLARRALPTSIREEG